MNVLPRAGRPTITNASLVAGEASMRRLSPTRSDGTDHSSLRAPFALPRGEYDARPMPIAYWDYIQVEPLLSLQKGIASAESELANDEVMFIVVHQIDELWFKLVLREMVVVRDLFARPAVPEQALASAVRGIRRMESLLRHLTSHFELMETMT